MTTTQATFDGAAFDAAAPAGGAFDEAKAEAFGGRIMSILTGSLLGSMVDIGYRIGLFAAAAAGPATSEQLAARAGLCERYVREWLGAVTTGGIVEYDEATESFFLPPEHAALLTTPAGVGPIAMANTVLAGHTHQLEALVRSRLRKIQRRPDLDNAFLGQTGLTLGTQ
jgi:winged helix-turn-helix protein